MKLSLGLSMICLVSLGAAASAQFGSGGAPRGPSFRPPTPSIPTAPRMTPPSTPRFTPPSPPTFEPPKMPEMPSFEPPKMPEITSYEPPEMPRYEPPEMPDFEMPEMPEFQPPTYTPPNFSSSQDFVEQKQCMECKKIVSSNSKVGDRCPHCGVLWTYDDEGNSAAPIGLIVGGIGGVVFLAVIGGIIVAVVAASKRNKQPAPNYYQYPQYQYPQQQYPQQNQWPNSGGYPNSQSNPYPQQQPNQFGNYR